jgi:hypothetical protein
MAVARAFKHVEPVALYRAIETADRTRTSTVVAKWSLQTICTIAALRLEKEKRGGHVGRACGLCGGSQPMPYLSYLPAEYIHVIPR